MSNVEDPNCQHNYRGYFICGLCDWINVEAAEGQIEALYQRNGELTKEIENLQVITISLLRWRV